MEFGASDLHGELASLKRLLEQSEQVQAELDRRVFHLKTLYDLSKDLFDTVQPERILKNALLMAMGNFGVAVGLAALVDLSGASLPQIISIGLKEGDTGWLLKNLTALKEAFDGVDWAPAAESAILQGGLPPGVELVVPFKVEVDCTGFLALGKKLVEEKYSENDRELIDTLSNNLSVAIKNARSFLKIKALNVELQTKNQQLENTLSDLKVAWRKVEILESIKSNLSKFVPARVSWLLEKSPTGEILDARERDVTVLFLDIEGYSRLTEQIGATRVNTLTERYFSVFMDAILEKNGDVVETAGDGLMVLFLTEDPVQNAKEAVQAAHTIMAEAGRANKQSRIDSQPVVINIGICSGQAFVGASKFESLAGARWTYTSHGTPINVAARLCNYACGGAVLVSMSTAERVKEHFDLAPLGSLALKNLSEEVVVFALKEPA